MMASVNGSLMRKAEPRPGAESISIFPPSRSRLVFTTSMPTPRPDTSLTFSAVETPGRKISASFSGSAMFCACSRVTKPFAMEDATTFSTARPLPSSAISITTCPA
jgi:hypothetical protein